MADVTIEKQIKQQPSEHDSFPLHYMLTNTSNQFAPMAVSVVQFMASEGNCFSSSSPEEENSNDADVTHSDISRMTF